nr:exodeoxyribonuclease VII large subunit [Betaproteobacteria bacterium]
MQPEFPSQAGRGSAPVSVSELLRSVRDALERRFPLTWVAGEISNFRAAASGHWYFTLKDEAAQVDCVMFRGRAALLDWEPGDGARVELRALVTLYEPRGRFQLNVETMRRAGLGALYERYLALKAKLERAGLFDPAAKRALPAHPHAIGVVTSLAAAALRDVLTTLARRNASIPVIVYPAPVQGEGAAERLAQMLAVANARAECEVLLLVRGGGSIEDLWSFNEEELARAIRASRIPVVVGVGHETDVTIADFAADRRAPTPTAAAELVSPPRAE